ncbi:MAG: NAD(P)-dependent oxidoreductase [Promethearchaeota archaeon]|nr:MAG: NAD(P)-dependent oxidoreductase [Candidatus Lokiarchaeota archaeon]
MKILITGAFGNLGQYTIQAALELQEKHELICYDIKNDNTVKVQNRLLDLSKDHGFKTIWGDICDKSKLKDAVCDADAVIHLAGLLHPKTEKDPKLSHKINVKGKRILLECMETYCKNRSLNERPKVILSSSVSIYGPWSPKDQLITTNTPIKPTDVYTKTKKRAEDVLMSSGFPWIILRITGAPPPSMVSRDYMDLLFEMPLEQQIEFIHPKDVGIALIQAAIKNIQNKILLIGGGKRCQITNRELMKGYFRTLGIKMISEDSFKKPKNDDDWFYVGWLDTQESQRLLNYQKHTFEDFLEDFKRELGWKRKVFKIFSPLIKKYLEWKSPYRRNS